MIICPTNCPKLGTGGCTLKPNEPCISPTVLVPRKEDDWIENMRTEYERQIAALKSKNAALSNKLGLLIAAIGPYSTTRHAIKAIERDRAERDEYKAQYAALKDERDKWRQKYGAVTGEGK